MRHTIWILAFFSSALMAECMDVHGVDAKETKQLLQQYGSQIAKFTQPLYAGLSHDADGFLNSPEGEKLRLQRQALKDKIKATHGYAYVEFDTIFYGKNEYCTTLEVIKSNQQDRLRYLPQKQKTSYPKKQDAISLMQAYQAIGKKLFFENNVQFSNDECPVYHCTLGFSHPKLKPYLEQLNMAAVKDRALILDTLKNDPDPTRRASAAYLVGHFHDPQDIVNVLVPSVNDEDDNVRNNVIRVLSLTTYKAHISDIHPAPFVTLLDSPFSGDRNKSLFLLSILAESESTKRYLIQHAKKPLLDILRLQQPNQHDFAYEILKKMSHQDFGTHDEARWSTWFDKHKNRTGRVS